MLEFLAGVVLAVAAPDEPTEIQLPIAKFELSADADGDRFEAVAIGTKAGSIAWRRARATFTLAAAPQAGHWLLCLGGPDLALEATLNGHRLDPIADVMSDRPEFRAGPRYDVAAEQLVAGENRVALVFTGERIGRGFEEGPAFLLSPGPSALLRSLATAHEMVPRIANLATLATAGKSGVMLDRIAFRTAADGSHRLAAQLAFSVVGPGDQEFPIGELEERKSTPIFPIVSAALSDKRIERFSGHTSVFAPLVANDVEVSRARAALFELGQSSRNEEISIRWRVRIFPARGGALHVYRNDRFAMLHNGVVGVAGMEAEVIGRDDAPLCLQFTLISKASSGQMKTMAGISRQGVVVGSDFESDRSDPPAIEAFAATMLRDAKAHAASVAQLASVLPMEPVEKAEIGGLGARVAAVANLAAFRERDGKSIFVPPEGPASAAAFFEDEWTLFNAPVRERATIEWLLSTATKEGAIRGDATGDLPPLCEIENDCYTVLRACRWFSWTYDGDVLRKFVPDLKRVLQRARSLADAEPLERLADAHPKGARRLALFHLRCAMAAAHRAFAEALVQLGTDEALAKESEPLASAQIAALQKQIGASGAVAPAAGDDPREEAIALVFALLEPPRAADLATRLGELPLPTGAADWREAVVARGLLEAGAIVNGRARTRALDAALRKSDFALDCGFAAYHSALVFGVLGVRRIDASTLEFLPRLIGHEQVRSAIPLPEGPVRIQIFAPAADLRRQLIVQNDATVDLMLVVGVPAASADEELRKLGETSFSLHRAAVPAATAWRPLIR